MLLAVVMALASQEAPAVQKVPVPLNVIKPAPRGHPENWLTDDDYPAASLRDHQFGVVKFRLDVDAKGRATGCHITATSGYSPLDEMTCQMMVKRSQFTPARDAAGQSVPHVYNASFHWVIPGGPKENPVSALAARPIDAVLSVNTGSKTLPEPALLRIVFSGEKVKGCHVELTSGSPKLDAVACEQATGLTKPLRVGKGWPEPDSRMVTVSFEAAK